MTDLPPYQPQRLAEGRYTFTLSKEPEKRRKTGGVKDFIAVTFFFRAEDENGNVRFHTESLVPWDDRYRDVLLALGGKPDEKDEVHLDDVDVIGQSFEASIIHEPDKNDPTKKWARIANIAVPDVEDDVPEPENNKKDEDEDDSVPF